MKILDTNAVDYIFDNNIILSDMDTYYATDDLFDEIEVTAFVKNKRIPKNILNISSSRLFSERPYYINYKELLNKFGHRSFSNMKGVADISILAAIKTVLVKINTPPTLPGFSEKVEIYTEDGNLVSKINREFNEGDLVVIHNLSDLL